jgi:DNA helicase-2/ATP-dependent DNA helicase PcrA
MSVPFDKLSDQQKALVKQEKGPLLVIAGPGTGKTEVLTHRVADLIAERKVSPDRILAITFGRKAAREMIERLSGMPKLQNAKLNVSTLHAESLKLLKEIGLGRKFLVADDEARLIVQDAAYDTIFGQDRKTLKTLADKLKLWKARNIIPSEVTDEDLQKFYRRYEELLDFNNAIDLDGLVLRVVRAQGFEEVSFPDHLLVDEYQDINQAEYELIRILARNTHGLFVVGDDDQSIYSWRGAEPEIIRRFGKDFAGASVEVLKESRRCFGHILAGAYSIVSRDPACIPKSVCSSKGDGPPIHILLSKSYSVEAYWITNWIKDHLSKNPTKPSEIVILVTTPKLAESLVAQLKIEKIEATYWRPGGFISDKDVIDVLAHIRLVADKTDNLALRRCFTAASYRVGLAAQRLLRHIAEKEGCSLWEVLVNARKFRELDRWRQPFAEFVIGVNRMEADFSRLKKGEIIRSVAKRIGVDQKVNVNRLRDFAESIPDEVSLQDFLSSINSLRGVDIEGGGAEPEEGKEAVAIMTMHSAKGLGYKIVFILGMDENILPDPRRDECEQRRLCYVAMTRAKQELFLCHSKMRIGPVARGHSFYSPSGFLGNIPPEHRELIYNEY